MAFYNEKAVKVGNETLRLVINWKAIDATEQVLGNRSYDQILGSLLTETASVGDQARVLWGMLREHHSGFSVDDAAEMVLGPSCGELGAAMALLITDAFPPAGEEKAKAKNPRKPRGASSASTRRGASRRG